MKSKKKKNKRRLAKEAILEGQVIRIFVAPSPRTHEPFCEWVDILVTDLGLRKFALLLTGG